MTLVYVYMCVGLIIWGIRKITFLSSLHAKGGRLVELQVNSITILCKSY